MRPTPSIVPVGDDRNVCLILDDFGPKLGRVWRETDEHERRENVIRNMLTGQYSDPVRVIAFNAEAGTCSDVSAEIGEEIIRRCADRPDGVPEHLVSFIDRHGGWRRRPLQLSLPIASGAAHHI
jgi:hypothetical protein